MRRNSCAFTIIELAVVVGIVFLLAATAIPGYNAYYGRQKVYNAASLLKSDLLLAVQTAKTAGVTKALTVPASGASYFLVSPSGTVQSRVLPGEISITVVGLNQAQQVVGAAAVSFPGIGWIGFLPDGRPVNYGTIITVKNGYASYTFGIDSLTGNFSPVVAGGNPGGSGGSTTQPVNGFNPVNLGGTVVNVTGAQPIPDPGGSACFCPSERLGPGSTIINIGISGAPIMATGGAP